MDEKYALQLENFFADNDRVIVRPGYTEHATGLDARVETLIPYTSVDGDAELFAVAGDSLYDVTAAGAVGAALVGSLSNAKWEYEGFSTSGGSYLLAANGVDTPLIYDGSTWTTVTLTLPGSPGYTIDSILWVRAHHRRLWFGIKGSTDLYYLAVDSISGNLILFNPGASIQKGGSVIAMGTWTRDSGAGPDDVAVFATSEGEFLVYEGTDPSSISTWSLTGSFRVGRPLGARCMVKFGGELLLITQDGLIQIKSLMVDRSQVGYSSVSKEVNKLITIATQSFGTTFGWQPIVLPAQRMIVINSPTGASTAKQYVFNAETKAASIFTGLNALCWAISSTTPYFGTADGKVMEFASGTTDSGTAITALASQAFVQMRNVMNFKRVNLIFFSLDDPQPAVQISTDYKLTTISSASGQIPSSIARWGVARWGVSVWAAGETVWSGWRPVNGQGRSVSVQTRTQTTVGSPAWTSTEILYVPSGSGL
jgi:hypothetical protein